MTHSEVAHEGGPGGRALHFCVEKKGDRLPGAASGWADDNDGQIEFPITRKGGSGTAAGSAELRHLDVTHLDIPITPDKVWQILKKKGVAE